MASGMEAEAQRVLELFQRRQELLATLADMGEHEDLIVLRKSDHDELERDALRFRKLEAALDAEYSFICDIDSGCSAGRYHPETGEPQSSYGKKFGALADALPDQ